MTQFASTTPEISNPSGIFISNINPLTFVVIGQTKANPTRGLYLLDETTKTGPLPVCSLPD
ncbi:hypothetical protein CYANOKiyG1_37390 [Okeania sp. KiyG1]|nr:hypothetical protein [Okeania sp. KiyG1]GGA22318.1 hypothetical protein CYANOKiyG1_37390 [Okeania sp. KiyG1]